MKVSARRLSAPLVVVAALVTAFVAVIAYPPSPARAADTTPYGLASMSQLDQLPTLDPAAHTGMDSTFQRNGGYDDWSGYLYDQPAWDGSTDRVYSDLRGPGEITRIWATRLDPADEIRIYFDGETVPRIDMSALSFFSGTTAPFRTPLVVDSSVSSGGYVSYLPLPFATSVRVTLRYRSGLNDYLQVNYKTMPSDTSVTTWTSSETGSQDSSAVRAMWSVAGTDPISTSGNTVISGTTSVPANGSTTVADISGSRSIQSIKLAIPGISSSSTQVTDDGRAFGAGGSSQFTVDIDPANTGVTLTRRLDYGVGNQKADVYIGGSYVGQWFDQGSVSPSATDAYWHFKNSSFTIPASFTSGLSSLSVSIRFVSSDVDWNEFYYWIYSTVGGNSVLTDHLDVDNTASESAHSYLITNPTWPGGSRTFYYDADPAITALLDDLSLRIYWDGASTPAVDSPIGSFFGVGQHGYSLAPNTLMVGMDSSGQLYCYFPMPFASHATVVLANSSGQAVSGVQYEVQHRAFTGSFDTTGYFSTEYRSQSVAASDNHDATLLDRDGSGSIVGVVVSVRGEPTVTSETVPFYEYPSISISGTAYFGWVEGDDKIYVDGNKTPSYHSTGIEDSANAGFGWQNGYIALPTHGMSSYSVHQTDATHYYDEMAYDRLFLEDRIQFNSHVRYTLEHGWVDNVGMASLDTLVYYYVKPTVRQVQTDVVDVGDAAAESAHSYSTSPASTVVTKTQSFEGDLRDTYLTDDGRSVTGQSDFVVAIRSDNTGVILRNRYDQTVTLQDAQVYVNCDTSCQSAGVWHSVGGNTSSGWKETDFQIPPALIAGESSLHVRLVNLDASSPWNEYRITAFSLLPGAGSPAPVVGATHNITNPDFETGDLTGWTVLGGSAFTNAHVTTQTVQGGVAFGQHGSYHYFGALSPGGDGLTGTMRSADFSLGGDGRIDFLIGGGLDLANETVSLVRSADNHVLFTATGKSSEAYTRAIFDAGDYVGTSVYLEASDLSTGGWGHVNLDDLHVPVSTLNTDVGGTWQNFGGSWTDVSGGRSGTASSDAFEVSSQAAPTDFSYEADVTITSTGAGALVFRANATATQFYAANIDWTNQRVTLWGPGVAGSTSAPETIALNTAYHLRVVVAGSLIQVYFDGGTTPAISITDATYPTGHFGLNVWNGSATLQNVTVTGSGAVVWPTSGQCLDRDIASGRAQIWDCNGHDNQTWSLNPDGSLTTGGVCLQEPAGTTANNTLLDLGTCTGGPNQQWTIASGDLVRNLESGRCLDVPDGVGSHPNGKQVQIYDCVGGPNQTWTGAA